MTAGTLALCALLAQGCSGARDEYCIGADISFVPQNEARGAVYKDENGDARDICEILAAHHFNNIRLRIFVNPEAEGGYSRGQGFCGLDHTVAMAKRIVDAGMDFALDFHYSDTWADPDKQYKPSAWGDATGTALEDSLYNYTRMVLRTLKEAGAAPKIVQIGNEISHGFVWPEGKVLDDATEDNWTAMLGLYKAGQRAVREVLPKAKLQVHLALGGENLLCREFLDHMVAAGAEFDIIGLSYYERWHETYEDMKANLLDLTKRYGKPVCIAEYGARKDNIRIINDIVRATPGGMGYGTMAWEPVGTLFGRDGTMNREIFDIYDRIYADYHDRRTRPAFVEPLSRDFTYDKPIVGADVSWLQMQENHGQKFSQNGVEKGALQILRDNGFNWMRLRLFVDPTAENGYSPEGYCGIDSTLVMAGKIKAAGHKFLLDLHFSDNWADPGKQWTPSAWARSSGSGLEGQAYTYALETIRRFIDAGVRPDMVQVGNEINHGMMWPQGQIKDDSFESFAVILRCATAGVRAADQRIPIMIHIACGGQNEESVRFFDKIISRDVKFDVIGQSYYPRWHGTLDDLRSNLNDLAARYHKPLVVVEYQDCRREVNEIVSEVPDGLGLGTFIWEATSPRWGNLFDKDGKTTEHMAVYPEFVRNHQ